MYLSLLVAPLAGAWIEIVCVTKQTYCAPVAPLAGAWIEITLLYLTLSLHCVAPLAGAWIEIYPGHTFTGRQ